MAEIVQHKCVSRMAVDCQQTGPAPQRDDVEVPAEPAVRLLAVGERFDVQVSLEGNGQAQFYCITSFHEE